MRNVYVEAHRRAMKEYYPPHLTGHGSRGVGLLDMVFFALNATNVQWCLEWCTEYTARAATGKTFMRV